MSGKIARKLIVYLDQNFLSEMAKAGTNLETNPLFQELYRLLHKGFKREKTVVPLSWFHKVESSLAPILKKRIRNYQAGLGQLIIRQPYSVRRFQVSRSIKKFLGKSVKPLDYSIAYHDDPDKEAELFDIDIDMHLENFDYKSERIKSAQRLNKLRQKIKTKNISYKQQLREELKAQRTFVKKGEEYTVKYLFKDNHKAQEKFFNSDAFNAIPIIDIYSKMWAKVLTDYSDRKISGSDGTDIDIISTYLPYIDVLATDSFMANLIKQLHLDQEYDIKIFSSGEKNLKKFENFVTHYLSEAKPVNIPEATIFVLADKSIKKHSHSFFHSLCSMIDEASHKGNKVRIHAFDDGDMPYYRSEEIPEVPIPFYGMRYIQQVRVIKIEPENSFSEILKTCREECLSKEFVILDSYRKLPDNFVETLMKYCREQKDQILGYKIYSTEG